MSSSRQIFRGRTPEGLTLCPLGLPSTLSEPPGLKWWLYHCRHETTQRSTSVLSWPAQGLQLSVKRSWLWGLSRAYFPEGVSIRFLSLVTDRVFPLKDGFDTATSG